MKHTIKYIIIFVFVFNSCISEQNTNYNELNKVKSLIIKEYFKYDSKYFNDRENCAFKHFIKNEIRDINFDHCVEDISIKYFYCPYNQFNFVLLKKYGKYYYYGLSDNFAYRNLLKSKYEKIEYKYRKHKTDSTVIYEYKSKADSLELFEDINNHGVTLLNEIININFGKKNLKDSYEYKKGINLNNIYALIYYINHIKSDSNSIIYEPIYTNISNSFEKELLDLMNTPNKNDSIYKLLVTKYSLLSKSYYFDKQAYFLKTDYLGIFIYDIIRKDGIIKINRYFIPEKRLPERISGYDLSLPYSDCNNR